MLRKAIPLLSTFRAQLIDLKKKYRGASLYKEAQEDAKSLYHTIPQDVQGWLDEENATAAVNGLGFFEISIPKEKEIVQWTRSHLPEFQSVKNQILASIGLTQVATAEDRDEVIQYLKGTVVPLLQAQLPMMALEDFEAAVKLFHRCKVDEDAVWADVCSQVMLRDEDISKDPVGAVRLFTVLARFASTNPVTKGLADKLVAQVDGMASYDYASFVSAVEKMAKNLELATILPALLQRLTRGAFSARDLAIAFASSVRMLNSLREDGVAVELSAAQLSACFERVKHRTKRHMNPEDTLYWRVPRDIISIAFAYESCNRLEHKDLFVAFKAYIAPRLADLSAREIAMTLGILRRVALLDNDLINAAIPLVKKDVGTFTDDELSHIALCLRDTDLRSTLQTEAAKRKIDDGPAKANLYASFGSETHAMKVSIIGSRQLVDLMCLSSPAPAASKSLRDEVQKRLEADTIPDLDLLFLATAAPQDMKTMVNSAVSKRMQRPSWLPTTMELLRVAPKSDVEQIIPRAVECAKENATSATQFVHMAEVLLGTAPHHPAVLEFIKNGRNALVNGGARDLASMVAFLRLLPDHPQCTPGADWFDFFLYQPFSAKFHQVSFDTLQVVFRALALLEKPLAETFTEALALMGQRAIKQGSASDGVMILKLVAGFSCGVDLESLAAEIDASALSPDEIKYIRTLRKAPQEQPASGATPSTPAEKPTAKVETKTSSPAEKPATPAATPVTSAQKVAAEVPADPTPAPAFVSKFAKVDANPPSSSEKPAKAPPASEEPIKKKEEPKKEEAKPKGKASAKPDAKKDSKAKTSKKEDTKKKPTKAAKPAPKKKK